MGGVRTAQWLPHLGSLPLSLTRAVTLGAFTIWASYLSFLISAMGMAVLAPGGLNEMIHVPHLAQWSPRGVIQLSLGGLATKGA